MTTTISSTQNQYIRQLILLRDKPRERKKQNIFLIEGMREVRLAIKAGYTIDTILYSPDITSERPPDLLQKKEVPHINISKSVYQKLAYRSTTEGLIAVAKSKIHRLTDLKLHSKTPLILVAEAPEKPGNIGAMLRTAEAAKLDAVIIANPICDLYNPNTIRSSMGSVFTNQIAVDTTPEVLSFLTSRGMHIYSADLQGSVRYTTPDYTKPTAIVVGSEAKGLSDSWLRHATQNIVIPMKGNVDSMNVSVSAGILVFEAVRQRYAK